MGRGGSTPAARGKPKRRRGTLRMPATVAAVSLRLGCSASCSRTRSVCPQCPRQRCRPSPPPTRLPPTELHPAVCPSSAVLHRAVPLLCAVRLTQPWRQQRQRQQQRGQHQGRARQQGQQVASEPHHSGSSRRRQQRQQQFQTETGCWAGRCSGAEDGHLSGGQRAAARPVCLPARAAV